MRAANPWKSYRETATLTAPPGQIVLMLYDGAIRSLERSLPGFSNPDPAEANMTINNNLQRAHEIIRQLNVSLNMQQGGEVAENLRRLYNYLEHRVLESNVKKNPTGVGEVIRHITVLRDAWATMLANQASPVPDNRPALVAA
ncbi:MAG TPA: flagellar export chaperone FliS [Verrucomicrobiae bacterium]|jgi:flagellar protein FliS|nr:flagellar export chaperone FliS [Verrucomicrobiae bacterium]